jgi:hypothetical protein
MRSALRGSLLFTFFLLFCVHSGGTEKSLPVIAQSNPAFTRTVDNPVILPVFLTVTKAEVTCLWEVSKNECQYKYKKKKGFRRLLEHSSCMYTRDASLAASVFTGIRFPVITSIPVTDNCSRDLIRGPPVLS